jgi:hypothetical protein
MNSTTRQIITQFRQLSDTDRQEVLRTLNQADWETEWDRLDGELPDVAMDMADIVSEVKATRRERSQPKAKTVPHRH